jgi:hypothetical protein
MVNIHKPATNKTWKSADTTQKEIEMIHMWMEQETGTVNNL